MKEVWFLLQRAFVIAYEENTLSTAKGAAYSGLLALFPVLTTVTALLVEANAQTILEILGSYVSEAIPPGTEDLILARFVSAGQKPISLLIVATTLAVYAASGFMLSLIEGFNAVYHIPAGRPFLKNRGIAAALVFGAAIPFVGASALIIFGARTEQSFLRWVQGLPDGIPVAHGVLVAGQIVRYALVLGAVVLATGLLYFAGPNRSQSWRNVWPGAWVATLLWLPTTIGFAWYVRNIANYNLMYGSIGAVIALLGWIYLIGAIAFVGCAYNAAREQLLAARARS